MKAIAKRLSRLEDQFGPADGKPRERFRTVLQPAGLRMPDLKHSTCRRILWPNGTLSETVELGTSSNGREVTDDELDRWVASFPIEEQEDGIRPVPSVAPGDDIRVPGCSGHNALRAASCRLPAPAARAPSPRPPASGGGYALGGGALHP